MLCVCVVDVLDVFCLYCEAWICRCSYMGSVSVSSCRCCMFVSCVHPVSVLNAVFCMTCSLLMIVEDVILLLSVVGGALLDRPCMVFHRMCVLCLLLLFAMIRSVLKSFKVPDVEVVAARVSNESALHA